MADRLRQLWNRPLRDGDRTRLFAIAVALIAATAAALTQLERPGPGPQTRRTATPTASHAPAITPGATPNVVRGEPSEEGTRTVVRPSPPDVTASKRAARRFLAGYLLYTYGRARARAIKSATGALHRRLLAQRPRVPAGERRRTPGLVLLQSNSIGHRHAELVALVEDGERRYTIALELDRTAAGWRVTRAGG